MFPFLAEGVGKFFKRTPNRYAKKEGYPDNFRISGVSRHGSCVADVGRDSE
jgi:hypothetical protein